MYSSFNGLKTIVKYNYIVLFLSIQHNLKLKEEGKFNTKLALEFLSAYLIKMSYIKKLVEKLGDKGICPHEFYSCMDLFLRVKSDTTFYCEQLLNQQLRRTKMLYKDGHTGEVLTTHIYMINDWQILYACHKVTNNILSFEI